MIQIDCFFLKKYSLKNKDDLKQKIEAFLELASKRKLKNRFNLMIDDETLNFLSNESAKQNQSKADFIRNLIRDSMEKN